MRQPLPTPRRGVALLLVLALLLITVTAAGILARHAATASLQRKVDRSTRLADDLLHAAEAPILHWLAIVSAEVVLPPDAPAPEVEVLHDTWNADGAQVSIHITAWDQLGMVQVGAAIRGSPLRLALPEELLRVTDSMPIEGDTIAGLDLVPLEATIPAFPPESESRSLRFVASGEGEDASLQSEEALPPFAAPPLAVGAFIATHVGDSPRINVNTAPIPLVEAALRAAGQGGLEQIIAARERGEAARAPAGESHGDRQSDAPILVASSDCWSFRIDIHHRRVHRSWWAVYQPDSSSTWRCVQRLAILD